MFSNSSIHSIPYWRLSGFYFLFFVTVGIFLPYWSLYLKAIGMNAEQIGILSAIVVVTKIFITTVWGWIVDHTGKRMRVIRFASLCSAISFSAALFIQDFWGLAIILFLFSLFWSASLPQIEAATLAHLGESTHGYTSIRVWGSISFIITVWALGFMFEQISIEYVPLLVLISMVVVWLMSLLLPEQTVQHSEVDQKSLKAILRQPQVLAIFAVCFLMLASHGPYYTFYSIYLEEHGYNNEFIGQMWALAVIAEVFVFIYMQRLIRGSNLHTLLLTSILFSIIRWLLIGLYVEHEVIMITGQLLHAATFGVYHAVAILYIHKFFRGKLQGRGQALYSSAGFGAGMAAGSLFSGYLWDSAGPLITFCGAAILALIALIIAWVWIRD